MKKRKSRLQPHLSVSEARAEAAAIVLRQLLVTMDGDTRARVLAEAAREAADVGVVVIAEEVREICDPPPAL